MIYSFSNSIISLTLIYYILPFLILINCNIYLCFIQGILSIYMREGVCFHTRPLSSLFILFFSTHKNACVWKFIPQQFVRLSIIICQNVHKFRGDKWSSVIRLQLFSMNLQVIICPITP